MMLEPERFAEAYCRDFDPSIYESIMTKGQDYKDWLKDRGMKVSGTNAELIERNLETKESVHIEDVERDKYRIERKAALSSAESRVGNACVIQVRCRWLMYV